MLFNQPFVHSYCKLGWVPISGWTDVLPRQGHTLETITAAESIQNTVIHLIGEGSIDCKVETIGHNLTTFCDVPNNNPGVRSQLLSQDAVNCYTQSVQRRRRNSL